MTNFFQASDSFAVEIHVLDPGAAKIRQCQEDLYYCRAMNHVYMKPDTHGKL